MSLAALFAEGLTDQFAKSGSHCAQCEEPREGDNLASWHTFPKTDLLPESHWCPACHEAFKHVWVTDPNELFGNFVAACAAFDADDRSDAAKRHELEVDLRVRTTDMMLMVLSGRPMPAAFGDLPPTLAKLFMFGAIAMIASILEDD